jgi:capsular polysaccharide biosynthesis protein
MIHVDQGVEILKLLGKLMKEEYEKVGQYFRREMETRINLKKNDLTENRSFIGPKENIIKNIEARNQELENDIMLINNNTSHSKALYTYAILQNLELTNKYKEELHRNKNKKEQEIVNLSIFNRRIQDLRVEIQDLENRKNGIQNIQILKTPKSTSKPVRPKRMLNVVVVTTLGLFIMIFLSFLLEYIIRSKMKSTKA